MENKELIRQILRELAQMSCSYASERSFNITEDCIKIKEKIEQYARELGVEPPDFHWDIYILPEEEEENENG